MWAQDTRSRARCQLAVELLLNSRKAKKKGRNCDPFCKVELKGFEPMTLALPARCSPTELQPQELLIYSLLLVGYSVNYPEGKETNLSSKMSGIINHITDSFVPFTKKSSRILILLHSAFLEPFEWNPCHL